MMAEDQRCSQVDAMQCAVCGGDGVLFDSAVVDFEVEGCRSRGRRERLERGGALFEKKRSLFVVHERQTKNPRLSTRVK